MTTKAVLCNPKCFKRREASVDHKLQTRFKQLRLQEIVKDTMHGGGKHLQQQSHENNNPNLDVTKMKVGKAKGQGSMERLTV